MIELFKSENRDYDESYFQARITFTNGNGDWFDPALGVYKSNVEIVITNGFHDYRFDIDDILKIELIEVFNLIDKDGFDYTSELFVRNLFEKE